MFPGCAGCCAMSFRSRSSDATRGIPVAATASAGIVPPFAACAACAIAARFC